MNYTEIIDSNSAVIVPTRDIADMQNTPKELYGKINNQQYLTS